MARIPQSGGVNKCGELRQILKANPRMPVKEVVANLAGWGFKVTDNLIYFIKGIQAKCVVPAK